MDFTPDELEAAQNAILSALKKCEKVVFTLMQKETPRTSQIVSVRHTLDVLNTSSALLTQAIKGKLPYALTAQDLLLLLQTMPTFISKIEKIVPKFKPGTPQHTLAVRRIRAFEIAVALAKSEVELLKKDNMRCKDLILLDVL